MREVSIPAGDLPTDVASFMACLATVLEFGFDELPLPANGEDPATGWTLSRWLGRFGLGLAAIASPPAFSWPGPWIAAVEPPGGGPRRFVVMYGVPSGVVWDPVGGPPVDEHSIALGFLVAASDVALALPPRLDAPLGTGAVDRICVFASPGAPADLPERAAAIPGQGLAGDRYVSGTGTFPSGPPGSALTLIEREVCDSFDPPLRPDEHRRNIVTKGIELNALVGYEFTVGEVRCRGMRLCEPCTVVDRYASRPVLRALVHRGGLRADILLAGEIRLGDPVGAI